jgi:hypothetical protein
LFVEESAVKRDDIVAKFGRLRAVLESSERAALAAYDEAVRCMVKLAEVEAEGVEVLAQQLSAQALAFCVIGKDCGPWNDVLTVGSVDIAMCGAGLEQILQECWKLVCCDSPVQIPVVSACIELCSMVGMT